ncbi:MAG: pilus assembly FimT family protein [Myxococcaceae bacterium]
MRRARGYTLLELGIVLGVIFILMGAVVALTSGFYNTARSMRTGSELSSLARAAADALRRNLVVVGPNYEFRPINGGAGTVPLNPLVPRCYNLSSVNPTCPATGGAGAAWSGPDPYDGALPVPAGSPLLAALGGTSVYGNGFNAWCEPYVACLYPFRVEVVTCVPVNVASAGLVGAVKCGTCGAPSPLTGEPTACVLVSVPTFARGRDHLDYSYSPELFQGDGLTLPDPSTPQTGPAY